MRPHYHSRRIRFRIARAMMYVLARCIRLLCPSIEATAIYLGPMSKGRQLWADVWTREPKHLTEEAAIARWHAHRRLDAELDAREVA